MASSNNNTIIMAAAGSAALLFAAATLLKPPSSTTTSHSESQSTLDPEECIQPNDVIAVFDDLFIHMQSVLSQLSQQIQQIQMAGQSIPEQQLRQLLKGEFERGLKTKQKSIFEKHDVDEDCLREATWEFMTMAKNEEGGEDVQKVKKAVERFQKLYENVSGEKVVGKLPTDDVKSSSTDNAIDSAVVKNITKEELIKAAKIYFDALTTCMGTIVSKAKAEGKDLHNPAVAQEMQVKFAEQVNEAGEDALKEEGLTIDDFKAAIEKYSTDPVVGRTLQMLQMKQQQELMALGVPTM